MSFVRGFFVFSASTFFLFHFLTVGVGRPQPVFAQSLTDEYNAIVDKQTGKGIIFANMPGNADACKKYGVCTVDQIMQLGINIITLILGISGSVVLLMFIYGGFLWITSRGDAKHVQEGKDTLTRAMIGFAIIVLSYSLINFVIAALVGDRFDRSLDQTVQNAVDGQPDGLTP